MLSLNQLKSFVREAVRALGKEKDLAAFEVYCSSSEQLVARLNYTSDIPCRGVEEAKSLSADGLAVRIVTRRDPHETGAGFEAGELSLEGLKVALERARRAAVSDPHFPGLPAEPKRLAPDRAARSDLMRTGDDALVKAAWAVVRSAVATFARRVPAALTAPGLVVGGDITLTRDRIALANSHFADVRSDQSAHFSASVAALIESMEAKGTVTALGASAAGMLRLAPQLGREAVVRALGLSHGVRPGSGSYRVLLGPQPVAEILNYMVVPSLTAGAFYAASSAYQGRFGATVMDTRLSLADDPRRGAIRRQMTCEGLPVRRVELVRDGRLVGLLSNFYDAQRLANDEERKRKLGFDGPVEFSAANGFRLGEGGERRFDAFPASAGINLQMRVRDGRDERELLEAVGNGIYVGRIWYTYPINGQRAGDFTCTISGDSYLIREGKLALPLVPNCLRINARIDQVFNQVVTASRRSEPALVWGSSEAYYVPAMVAEGIPLVAIGDEF